MRFDLALVHTDTRWFVMCGRSVYGTYASEDAAKAAIGAPALGVRRGVTAKAPSATDRWENEGGACVPRVPRTALPHAPLPRRMSFAMVLCPDCLRTKPHWVAWEGGTCRAMCQECGRVWEMQNGMMMNEIIAEERNAPPPSVLGFFV